MPVSNDTLIRVVRRRAQPRSDVLNVVDIDDFAFRRNHHYGSIVCYLERRRIVKLLPDREIVTIAAWLVDRGGSVCLNKLVGLISGSSAGVRPLREAAG